MKIDPISHKTNQIDDVQDIMYTNNYKISIACSRKLCSSNRI